MKSKLFIAVALVLSIILSHAQNIKLTPKVKPAKGGTARSGNFMLTYTIGQPVRKTFTHDNTMLTQGFQQLEKPLAPTAPANQTVCSDTPVTFVLSGRIAGKGANQTEWSYFPDFTYSYFNGTDSALKITVNIGNTDTIYFRSRVSGNKLVSDSVVSAIFKVNYKPQAPLAPIPQSLASDTPYTFTFLNLRPGAGGNRLEWAFDSAFATNSFMTCFDTIIDGKDTSDCTISVILTPPSDTMLWLRCMDTVSGCISDAHNTIAILDTGYIEHTRHFDTLVYICTGTSFDLPVPASDHHKLYYLRVDTTVVTSAFGNDSLLIINTGPVDTNAKFNVLALDTGTLATTCLDTSVVILVTEPVDTPAFAWGDTLVDKNDTADICYVALADNAYYVTYNIVSGGAVVDSNTGCLTSVTSSFTIRATAVGLTGCGQLSTDLHVTVTDVAPPLPPADVFKVIDSPSVVYLTFDTVYAGNNGDQIEWSGKEDFSSSTTLSSPAVISFAMYGPADSIIYLRSVDSKTGHKSQARSTQGRIRQIVYSTGLIDKRRWTYSEPILGWSDEFSYKKLGYTELLPSQIPVTSNFDFRQKKWVISGQGGADPSPFGDCFEFFYKSNADLDNICVMDYAGYRHQPAPDLNKGVAGDDGEVTFKDGICHIKATRLHAGDALPPFILPCFTDFVDHSQQIDRSIYYKSGTMTTRLRYSYDQPILIEMRAKLPVDENDDYLPKKYHIGFGTIWDDNINVFESTVNNPGPSFCQNVYPDLDFDHGHDYIRRITPVPHCGSDNDWRTYSCMINKDEIIFFVDGKETYSLARSDCFKTSESADDNVQLNFSVIITGIPDGTDQYNNTRYKPIDGQQDEYDLWVDYMRVYFPSPVCSLCTPLTLQNQNQPGGTPKTLESPNQNGQGYNSEKISDLPIRGGTTLSLLGTGSSLKLYFQNTSGIGLESSKSTGAWITNPLYQTIIAYHPADFLHLFGHPVSDFGSINSSMVTAANGRIFFKSIGGQLKYFQKNGSVWDIKKANTQWGTFPLNNCVGNIITDDQNRVWYKGVDNNIWCWNPFYNHAFRITNNSDVQGAFVVSPCGCLLFYRDDHDNLVQMYWDNNGWHTIYGVVANQTLTDNMALDEPNGRLYFIGQQGAQNAGKDGAIYCYAYKYSFRNPNGATILGYSNADLNNNATLCDLDNNAAANLVLNHRKDMLFYKSNHADNGTLWYYFKDYEKPVAQAVNDANWNETTRDYYLPINGSIATESLDLGRLFYAGGDGKIYAANWVTADYPIVAPDCFMSGYDYNEIPVYKTDGDSANSVTEDADSKYILTDSIEGPTVSVLPNPSNGKFSFLIGNLLNEPVMFVRITDVKGNELFARKIAVIESEMATKFTWNADGMNNGVYFYSIRIKDRIFTGKLVKI